MSNNHRRRFCSSSLPPELNPFFDRNVVEDTNGLDMLYINQWIALAAGSKPNQSNARSLRILSNTRDQNQSPDLVGATFQLSRADLHKLKKRKLKNGAVLDGAEDLLTKLGSVSLSKRVIGVAGSNRFGVYGTDFGWGKPVKVEITSLDKSGAIAKAENGDGNGGVEVGLVFNKDEMELFASVFHSGLEVLPYE
ncbi:Phenolic glucoside malonyltransferase [Quillaja saponaria]|uniref:Phenolic glucoside malonyltransferase n=1 Tax=Quillaja saponaria TaxID=32244 RepID=A0AAD7VG59_QUISA|nr:Phenolic glucoside malonyltransferase [Quillaja saponaria]